MYLELLLLRICRDSLRNITDLTETCLQILSLVRIIFCVQILMPMLVETHTCSQISFSSLIVSNDGFIQGC